MKLEINNKRKAGKSASMWKLNNTSLNTNGSKKKAKEKTKIYTKANENGNTAYQNLWDAAKTV